MPLVKQIRKHHHCTPLLPDADRRDRHPIIDLDAASAQSTCHQANKSLACNPGRVEHVEFAVTRKAVAVIDRQLKTPFSRTMIGQIVRRPRFLKMCSTIYPGTCALHGHVAFRGDYERLPPPENQSLVLAKSPNQPHNATDTNRHSAHRHRRRSLYPGSLRNKAVRSIHGNCNHPLHFFKFPCSTESWRIKARRNEPHYFSRSSRQWQL